MKFAVVTTLLFVTLALANPAPVAEPEAVAAPAPVAQSAAEAIQIESRAALDEVLEARVASPELDARAAGLQLETRKSKTKPKSGKNNSTNSSAISLTPSRALQLGALSVGVMEVVRLWG